MVGDNLNLHFRNDVTEHKLLDYFETTYVTRKSVRLRGRNAQVNPPLYPSELRSGAQQVESELPPCTTYITESGIVV